MLSYVKILDEDGNIIDTHIPIPEQGRVVIEDTTGAFIEIKNSSEECPIGIIVDVFGSDNELFTLYTDLTEVPDYEDT